jgi:plasmid stability protein
MASMTIRNLDDGVMKALEAQAARKGISAEEEARRLLGAGVEASVPAGDTSRETAWERLQRFKDEIGGGIDFELDLPDRKFWKMRPVDFGE